MEAKYSQASFGANLGFLGSAVSPPKKRNLDKGKTIAYEAIERNGNSSEMATHSLAIRSEIHRQVKAMFEQLLSPEGDAKPEIPQKKQESGLPIKVFSNANKGEKGESSKHLSDFVSPPPPSQYPIVCKFPTTQALGGHSRAHKQEREREMERAMKEAQGNAENPFPCRARVPLLQDPDCGKQIPCPPYHGSDHSGWKPTPVYYPTMDLNQDPPEFSQDLDGLKRPSFMMEAVDPAYEPGWPSPCVNAANPILSPRVATTFDPSAAPNMTTFSQDEGGLAKKQCMESTWLSLSSKAASIGGYKLKRRINGELQLRFNGELREVGLRQPFLYRIEL